MLTDQDRETLRRALHDGNPDVECSHSEDYEPCAQDADTLVLPVEAIVARHIAAALEAAAETIDGWREMAVWAAGHTEDPDQAQNSVIRSRAYHRAASIVRAAAHSPPT